MFTIILEENRSDNLPATSCHIRYERAGDKVVPVRVERSWVGDRWTVTRVRQVPYSSSQGQNLPREALVELAFIADRFRAPYGIFRRPIDKKPAMVTVEA